MITNYMELIISIVVGGLITWLFSHIYYKKSVKFSNKFYPKDREKILSSYKKKLSIKDLNELLEEKTIDYDTDDPLPYKACPRCGNEELERSQYSDESDIAFFVSCPKCKWTKMG